MIADIKKSAEQKMQKSLEALKLDLGKVRTGRAHTGLLDHITVDYYGAPTPLPQVANIQTADSRTLTIQPWERKIIGAIEKSILAANIGITPQRLQRFLRQCCRQK